MKRLTATILALTIILALTSCGSRPETPILDIEGQAEILSALSEDEPSETTGEETESGIDEEALRAEVLDFAEGEIAEFLCADFDGDGKKEAFAVTGKNDSGMFAGSLVFASDDGCETAVDGIEGWYGEETEYLSEMDIGGRDFVSIYFCVGAHGEMFKVFTVIDGKLKKLNITEDEEDTGFEFGSVGKEDDNSLRVGIQSYTGITKTNDPDYGYVLSFQDYYFYWDESAEVFREYGAIEVTRKEAESAAGTKAAFDLIDKRGYKIDNILFRGNGMIEINFYVPTSQGERQNGYMTLKYDSSEKSFKLVDEEMWLNADSTDSFFYSGICLPSISDDPDTPQRFLDLKEWYK